MLHGAQYHKRCNRIPIRPEALLFLLGGLRRTKVSKLTSPTRNLTSAVNVAKLLLATELSTSSAANARNVASSAFRISRRSRFNFRTRRARERLRRHQVRRQRGSLADRYREVAEERCDRVGVRILGLEDVGEVTQPVVLFAGRQRVRAVGCLGHERHADQDRLDLSDDAVVCLLGGFAADWLLVDGEVAVHAEGVQEGHFFGERGVLGF